ncbi:MAG: hypothetical protein NTX62_00970, partial [Deltaproteobacteria bacterium]|nr:hypothetical protein [Deltaproteobacteria bacterium]
FELVKIPTGSEVCEKQLYHLVDKVKNTEIQHQDIGAFLPAVYEKLKGISKEEIIQRFVSAEFNRFLSYYRNAPDINVDLETREGSSKAARHATPPVAAFKKGKFKKRQVQIEHAGRRNHKEKGNKGYSKSRNFSSSKKRGRRFSPDR